MSKDLITWKLKRNNTCDNIVFVINNALKGHSIAFIGNIYNMSATEDDSNSIRFSLVKAAKNSVHIHIYVEQYVADAMRQNRIVNRIMNMQSVVIHIVRDWKKFNIGEEMKFDAVIMNPPYDKNLHITILNAVKPFAYNIINISPIGKMQYALAFNEELPVKNMAIDRISMDDANKIFPSAEIREDLGIWYNGKCSTSIVPNYTLVRKLITKLQSYNTGLISTKFEKIIGNYPVKFVYGATIAGHGGHGKACYRIISTNDNTAFSKNPTGHVRYINVKNEQEQKDLQKIYNLTFLRFCYYIIERGNTPYKWLPIFDNTYNNKKFCNEFEITGYIDDKHAELDSEWEIMLNTMKEYM